MPLTADHYADVAVHWTIAGVAVMQVMGWMVVGAGLSRLSDLSQPSELST